MADRVLPPVDGLDVARAIAATLHPSEAERLAQACVERGRPKNLAGRIHQGLRYREEAEWWLRRVLAYG
jgi:hypothetical protein